MSCSATGEFKNIIRSHEVSAEKGYTMVEYVKRAGEWRTITPENVGWTYISFEVIRLATGESRTLAALSDERAYIPLSGTARVVSGAGDWTFGGRRSVFDGLASMLYLPLKREARVEAIDGDLEIAVAAARAQQAFAPVLITPDELSIEVRGAGNATRQLSTLMPPSFPADRLHVVEVWTPGGNWSSYPPHKHDRVVEGGGAVGESVLEETYYYRTRASKGFALQRLYSPERGVDYTTTVRDGDILAIPFGYHTTVAAQGHDLYYLNVLAGPGPKRTLQASDDPALTSVREQWEKLGPDPRVPFVPRHPNAERRRADA
jgi:5-deoxy-glucuronate isomerase